MFVAVSITAYITVFTLFLTAVTIGLVTDQRRIRQGEKSLRQLRRQLDNTRNDGGQHRTEAETERGVLR
jgi:hypothetical protein